MSGSVGNRLHHLRQHLAYSQRELARNIGISPATIGFIENGQREPSREFLEKLHLSLRVSADWLLFGEGEMFLPSKGPGGETDELSDAPGKPLNSSSVTEINNEDAAQKMAHDIKTQFDTAYEHEPRAPSGAFFLFIGAFSAIWLLFFRLIGVL